MFNEQIKNLQDFENKNVSNQLRHQMHTGSRPKFARGSNESQEFMMGFLEIKYKNGKTDKICAISGENPFDFGNDKFEFKTTNGFHFVNKGSPSGTRITNIVKKEPTIMEYNRSCAAQKLLSHISELPNYKQSEIEHFEMYETYFVGKNLKKNNRDYICGEPARSCKHCRKILPYLSAS